MKGLAAGLTFFNFAAVCALLLGLIAGGLGPFIAFESMFVGAVAAVFSYFGTVDPKVAPSKSHQTEWRYGSLVFWFVVGCFTIFAVRSFCWLLYIDGPELRIQSVNNLGDL